MGQVLVIDDDRFFLAILGDFVTNRLGMHPVLVQDGASALALLEKEPVDLVLLDIMMPGMDGLEVLQRIKERHPSLPVIMVTGSELMEHAIAALREGADDFIRKPPDIDELEFSVTRVLTKVRGTKLPPPPCDAASERRRAARLRLRLRAPALLQLREVSLIDISLSGALVEHTEPVRPGEIYHLSFSVEGQQLQVLARAIRAFASHHVTVAGGERQMVYRTGMEFLGVEKNVAALIAAYMDRLRK
jgi:DNA-binding response OmpR family regulator